MSPIFRAWGLQHRVLYYANLRTAPAPNQLTLLLNMLLKLLSVTSRARVYFRAKHLSGTSVFSEKEKANEKAFANAADAVLLENIRQHSGADYSASMKDKDRNLLGELHRILSAHLPKEHVQNPLLLNDLVRWRSSHAATS
jgi:hypothetical protein